MMLLVNQAVLVTVECAATCGDVGVGSGMDMKLLFDVSMSKDLCFVWEGGFFQLKLLQRNSDRLKRQRSVNLWHFTSSTASYLINL